MALILTLIVVVVSICHSVDIDEEECERRKAELSNEMVDLEKQFVAIKEQLYYERLSQVEHKLNEVRAERAVEYLQPYEELLESKRVRQEVAEILRDLRKANVKCLYDAENYAAKQNFDVSTSIAPLSRCN